MRALLLSLSLLSWATGAIRCQEIANESLLQAPAGRAVPTWTTTTFEAVQASVVYVAIEVEADRGKFVIERPSSGVIVDASGLVLTFDHLIEGTVDAMDKRLFVQLNDAANTQLDAKVVARDVACGLALLRVTPPADGLRAVRLGSDRPDPGEPVLCVARPEGKDMLAFAGVASPALGPVALRGQALAERDVFLTDSRNDARCDGAPVFGSDGTCLGLYSAEHIKREVTEPTLADLKRPSFGVVLAAASIRRAFSVPFSGSANPTLARAPERDEHPFAKAVALVAPSVVGVFAGEGDWPTASKQDPGCVQRVEGLGSGVVLSRSGLVVTNAHLLRRVDDLRVKVDGKVYAAEVVKRRLSSQLALLKVDLPDGVVLTAAACAPDDDVALGEAVLACGNPTGTQVVVSGGVVSAMRTGEGGRIQADANLGNANGGGAILNAAGRVIGIGDAGRTDPIEMAFAMRGDRAAQETNLSTFLGIRQVRRIFRSAFDDEAAADESIVAPVEATAGQRSLRNSVLCEMVRKASGAMLNIYVARNTAVADPDDPFPPAPNWQTMSLGSGVIIDRTGLAISNWHVVDAGTNPDGSSRGDVRITARVFGGKEYEVQVLSISREDDLSLIQLVLAPGEQVDAVELGSSERLAIGEAVAAIGNPHGRANTITYGVVSATGKGIRIRGRWAKLKHLIETDAAINGGNSGGALLDMSGRLVGINSAGGGTFNNVGYAIAVDHVRQQITGLLMQPYKLRSVDLGMRVLDDEGEVVVMDVDDRGPAARVGVRSGDRVRTLAGVAIGSSPEFAMTLRKQAARVPLELTVQRDGERLTLKPAPLDPVAWSVLRQAGMQVADFPYGQDAERVRLASIDLYRKFSGDPSGEPRSIPEQVVLIERVFAGQRQGAIAQEGDLLLAVELQGPAGPAMRRIGSAAELRDLFNDRQLSSYDGVTFRCWVARGKVATRVEVQATRLLW